MMKQLIVTCDDCGLSEGINLATAELYEKGIATAASVMTNFPAAHHAFELFARYPDLEMGVHLNLTDGYPLTDLKSATPVTRQDGRFHPKGILHLRALWPSAMFLQLVESELRAQIDIFITAGIRPQHVTTHQHFHSIPSLRRMVLQLAQEYKIPWVRATSLVAGVVPQNPFFSTRETFPTDKGIFMPDHLIGVKWWVGRSPEQLMSVLRSLEGIVEVVIHPCTAQDSTYPRGVGYPPHERFEEMRYLESLHPMLADLKLSLSC
jgi:predicted glycoside hydrolase/deacetylase ChbG (UPF0249 family)